MVVMAVGAAVAVAASIYSEHKAQAAQAKSEREARRIMEAARQKIAQVAPPNPESQKLFYEQLESVGELSPDLEQATQVGPSAYDDIETDAGLRQSQLNALAQLEKQGQGELNAGDRYSLAQIQGQAAQQERGSREAILQSAQRRGTGGSGMELLANLQAQQSAADRSHIGGLQQASAAQQRALDAMMQGGQLAGSIRNQDFSEQDRIASARDVMSKFNAGLMADTNQRNVDRSNQAQAGNLQNRQRIADVNTGIRNSQQEYNKGLIQQDYQNRMAKAQAEANAMNGQASATSASGQRQADNNRKWGQIASSTATGVANTYDKRKKDDDEEWK